MAMVSVKERTAKASFLTASVTALSSLSELLKAENAIDAGNGLTDRDDEFIRELKAKRLKIAKDM